MPRQCPIIYVSLWFKIHRFKQVLMKTRYFEVCFILHLCKKPPHSVAWGHPVQNTGCLKKHLESNSIFILSLMALENGDDFIKRGEMSQCGANRQLRSVITTSDRASSSSLKAIIATIITGKDHKKDVFPDAFPSAICSAARYSAVIQQEIPRVRA